MKTPKSKRKSKRVLEVRISEERALQLSNDLSEGIVSGSTAEWRGVARYFQNQLQQAYNDLNAIRPSIAAMTAGLDMIGYAKNEMKGWINRVKS